MTTHRRIRTAAWLFAAAPGLAVAIAILGAPHHERSAPRAAAAVVAPAVPAPAPSVPASPAPTTPAPTAPAVDQPPAEAARAVPPPGMVVGVDPETGKLGAPSPEQMRQLSAASAQRPVAGELREVHNPDGSYSITLDDRFQQYSLARVGPSGAIETGCVQGARAAAEAVADSLARRSAGREER